MKSLIKCLFLFGVVGCHTEKQYDRQFTVSGTIESITQAYTTDCSYYAVTLVRPMGLEIDMWLDQADDLKVGQSVVITAGHESENPCHYYDLIEVTINEK